MTTIKKAAEAGSWPLATNQADVKAQLTAMLDGLRQLLGNANIASGSGESTDPLTAPFRLYVDPYIGRDTFACRIVARRSRTCGRDRTSRCAGYQAAGRRARQGGAGCSGHPGASVARRARRGNSDVQVAFLRLSSGTGAVEWVLLH